MANPDLRTEIERLRDRRRPTAGRLFDAAQQGGVRAALAVRVAAQRIRELETDNKRLRHALAEALGERRAAGPNGPRPDTPRPRISRAIGPC